MINFDFVDRAETIATAAYVCWHCDDPTCAQVCPADAIKKGEDGIVRSALKPRCIACSNCVLACPFGIPKMIPEYEQMMKCDMCYDRTSVGKQPDVRHRLPQPGAGLREARRDRARGARSRRMFFSSANQKITTKVYMMTPSGTDSVTLDITEFMWEKANA